MVSEEQLIRLAKDGDNPARRELYTRYSGCVMTLAMRYMADRDAACDVLQDCFVRVFTSIDRFSYRGAGSFRSWILRIATNLCVEYLRRSARMDMSPDLPDVADDVEPDVSGVPLEEIIRMIGMLPAGYRTVFNLYVLEQKSHREIAALLDIKESTSASQFLWAKMMLAKMIKNYENKQ